MNKNLKNTIITNFPILSIIILGLIYLYLELPENVLEQRGGEKTFNYPSNIPFMYKYRFAFVAFPILLFFAAMYYAYFTHVTLANYNVWDLGLDFFANFQKQYKIAVSQELTPIDYTYDVNDAMKSTQPDLAKFFNMIQLTGNPLSAMYIKGQYFCNSIRPCNCCLEDGYVSYFFGCPSATDTSKCIDQAGYNKTCKPSGK